MREHFGEYSTFVALVSREGGDWGSVVVEAARAVPVLQNLNVADLKNTVLGISSKDAFDVARLISGGSLLYGPPRPIENAQRDACLLNLFEALGEHAEFFTNHGEAEDGETGDFSTLSCHVNVLAETTIDVCLIGVSDSKVLILWRFEDD
ncbi:hypothetical protein [Streptomyces thermospinosisporus]|uniref:hypothetical protein n=1 Tax=Streptomyces thermospinosisporus TaxID=161482 RepID=UPI0031D92645